MPVRSFFVILSHQILTMEISSLEQLEEAAAKRHKSVIFNFPDLSEASNSDWEKRFNYLFDECGCASGQKFITYSLPFLIVGLIALSNLSEMDKTWILGIFILAVLIAGAAGKITGLIQRNYKLKRLIDEFKNVISQE